MEKIKWQEKTWVIILCLLFFAPLGLYLILRSKRHKIYIKVVFVIIFLVLLPLFFSFNFMGIPLYYFDYSRISSAPPLPPPEKIEEERLRQGKIYLVPVGKVSEEFLKELIPYVEERFHYKTEIASPLELKTTCWSPSSYWIDNWIFFDKMENYPAPSDAVKIIGITDLDILDWDTLKEYWRESEGRLDRTLNRELYFLNRIYPYFPKPIYYALYYSLIGPKVKGENIFWLSDVHAPGKLGFISLYRLREPVFFWKNREILLRRAVTEITLTLGQSFGFTNCPHKYCVMREHWDKIWRLDEKKAYFCLNCKLRIETLLALHDYLITGDLDSQERFALQAIDKDPQDVVGHTMLGLVYKEKREYQKAEYELREALKSSPENEVAFYLLGEVYYARAQESLKRAEVIKDYMDKEPEEILTFAKRGLISEPDSSFYRMLTTFAYFKMEDYEKAEEEIDKIKKEQAGVKELKIAINEMNWAKEKYQKVYQINQCFPSIFYNYALDFDKDKEYDKAIKFYKQAIRINSEDARYHSNLGSIYLDKKEYKDAIKAFRKALEVDPDHAKAYVGLGYVYGSLGDFEKARLYLKEAQRLDPSCEGIYFALGLIYEKEGNIEMAIGQYKKSIPLGDIKIEDFQGNVVNVEERIKALSKKLENPN